MNKYEENVLIILHMIRLGSYLTRLIDWIQNWRLMRLNWVIGVWITRHRDHWVRGYKINFVCWRYVSLPIYYSWHSLKSSHWESGSWRRIRRSRRSGGTVSLPTEDELLNKCYTLYLLFLIMYFGYNHNTNSHPHSMSLPSHSMTLGMIN